MIRHSTKSLTSAKWLGAVAGIVGALLITLNVGGPVAYRRSTVRFRWAVVPHNNQALRLLRSNKPAVLRTPQRRSKLGNSR